MNNQILMVDDEELVLRGYRRSLGEEFDLLTAKSVNEAIDILSNMENFISVVVSDMRMPGRDGLQLIRILADKYPDIVRIMLTGNFDQKTTVNAVNVGKVFRFLNKPCSMRVLRSTLIEAQSQFELTVIERDILENTVQGCIEILIELLSVIDPQGYVIALQAKKYVLEISKLIGFQDTWRISTAAILSQIGYATLPKELLHIYRDNYPEELSKQKVHVNISDLTKNLLQKIPRLESISELLEQIQDRSSTLTLEAEILSVALEISKAKKINAQVICDNANINSPEIIKQVFKILNDQQQAPENITRVDRVSILEIPSGAILKSDIYTQDDQLLIAAGHELTASTISRIQNFSNKINWSKEIKIETENSEIVTVGLV